MSGRCKTEMLVSPHAFPLQTRITTEMTSAFGANVPSARLGAIRRRRRWRIEFEDRIDEYDMIEDGIRAGVGSYDG